MEGSAILDKAVALFAGPEPAERHTEVVKEVARLVSEGGSTVFSSLVNRCAPLLSDPDDPKRGRGTLLLASVLSTLFPCPDPQKVFNSQTFRVVYTFFLDRIEDQSCLTEVLKGLHSVVVSAKCWTGDDQAKEAAQKCVSLLRENYHPSTHSQTTRLQATEIVTECLLHGADPVSVARLVAKIHLPGERDPRNTRAGFTVLARALGKAPSKLSDTDAKELFEGTSSFFPVLFVPSTQPGSAKPVTKEELSTALRLCLAANHSVASLAVPFLLERTGSSIPSARADAFFTAASCVRSAGPSIVKKVGARSWAAVREHGLDTPKVGAPAAAELLSCLIEASVEDSKATFIDDALDTLTRSATQPLSTMDDEFEDDQMAKDHGDSAKIVLAALAKHSVCAELLSSKAIPYLVALTGKKTESDEESKNASETLALLAPALAVSTKPETGIVAKCIKTLIDCDSHDSLASATVAILAAGPGHIDESLRSKVVDTLAFANASNALCNIAPSLPTLVATRSVPTLPLSSLPKVAQSQVPEVFSACLNRCQEDFAVLRAVLNSALFGDNAARLAIEAAKVLKIFQTPSMPFSEDLPEIFSSVSGALPVAEQLELISRIISSKGVDNRILAAVIITCSDSNCAPILEKAYSLLLPMAVAGDEISSATLAKLINRIPADTKEDLVSGALKALGDSENQVCFAYLVRALLLKDHKDSTASVNQLCAKGALPEAIGVLATAPSRTEKVVGEYQKRAFTAMFTTLSTPGSNPASLVRSIAIAPKEMLTMQCVDAVKSLLATGNDLPACVAAIATLSTGPSPVASAAAQMAPKVAAIATSGQNPGHIRLAALEALYKMRDSLPEPQALLVQRDVTDGLVKALDDPRRAVRQQAVVTRNAWLHFSDKQVSRLQSAQLRTRSLPKTNITD